MTTPKYYKKITVTNFFATPLAYFDKEIQEAIRKENKRGWRFKSCDFKASLRDEPFGVLWTQLDYLIKKEYDIVATVRLIKYKNK